MTRVLKALVGHLRNDREFIVQTRSFLVEDWDPTYGQQDPITENVDVVDFDRLLESIDKFTETFK